MHHAVFIGPAGWSYPDWKGIVYPRKMTHAESELEYISHYFNLVEVNSTFYRFIDENTAIRWLKQVKRDETFRFTCKLHQSFTHQREGIDTRLVNQVNRGLAPLLQENRLLALLIQFPWSFKNDESNRAWLRMLFETFSEYPLALEVRHKSWHQSSILKFMANYQVSFVNIDQPAIGNASSGFTSYANAATVYFRFHGRNTENWFKQGAGRNARYDYLYSPEEIETFIESLRPLIQMGKTVIGVYNNHFRGQAVVNALQTKAELIGTKVAVPKSLVEFYPQLKAISKPNTYATTLDLF